MHGVKKYMGLGKLDQLAPRKWGAIQLTKFTITIIVVSGVKDWKQVVLENSLMMTCLWYLRGEKQSVVLVFCIQILIISVE